MSSDAYTPSTSIVSPPINGLPRTYVSEREKAPETSLPARGSVLGMRFGPLYKDHIVIDAVEVPRGGRKFEQITHCEALPGPVMNGSRKLGEINAILPYTEQIVDAGDFDTSDPNVTFQPIDEVKSIKRTEIPPTDALDAYYQTFPSSANFDLPAVLVSVAGVWHEEKGEGESSTEWKGLAVGQSRSLSGNESTSVQSSAGLIPEIVPVIRHVPASRIPTTSHFFYLPMPVTQADILSRVGASSAWPIFKPESVTFALSGTKVSVQAHASASAAFGTGDNAETGSVDLTKGQGKSFDYSPYTNAVTLPPTIHAELTVSNATHADVEINALANAGWIGDKGTTLEDATSTPAWADVAGMPSVTSESSVDATASGSITPTTIPATTPSSIPTSGIYLIDSKVSPYDFGYARVYAETVNASVFA